MNSFGEFLYILRKESGMTQATLAERLGVTNKAVSKWETGEAMPETGLLLPLAEIFGVTVDELLNGRRSDKESERTQRDEMREHIFTRGKDNEPETALDKICGAVCAAVVLCGIFVYLMLGAFKNAWNPHWIIVPVSALSCGIIGIIFALCDKDKRRRAIEKGKNPYTASACGIIMLCCIIAYLCCGAFASLWHPCWIIIIAGVVVDGIIGSIGDAVSSKKKIS